MNKRKDNKWIWCAAALIVGYFLWIKLGQTIAFSIITYALFSGVSPFRSTLHKGKLQEINDLYTAGEIYVITITALSFVILIRALYPIVHFNTTQQIRSLNKFKTCFLPGLLKGLSGSIAFSAALILSGHYKPASFFIQLDEAGFASLILILKTICIFILIFCEELLFRKKLLEILLQSQKKTIPILICTFSYVISKTLQFELGLMQLCTLTLISFLLTLRAIYRKDFLYGTGLWVGGLFVFHIVLGFPILGVTHTGVLSMKYTGMTSDIDLNSKIIRLLTGGNAGPLSSFALQFLLVLTLFLEVLKRVGRVRKLRLNPFSKSIK